jgi:hypothetical protein
MESFDAFYRDIGMRPSPKHTLERIDNDRGYFPGNVRWATRREQNRNKRNNHQISFMGETHPMAEWAEIFGINYNTLRDRLQAGWPIETALSLLPEVAHGR